MTMQQETIRETVGIFNSPEKLDAAIKDLETTAFPRHDISVLAPEKKVEEQFGVKAIRPEWLEDNADAPRGVAIHPEERRIGRGVAIGVPAYFGGCIAAVMVNPASNVILLSAVALGSAFGAVIGAAAAATVSRKFQRQVRRQLEKGGLLLWVRTPGPRRERTAMDILRKHGAHHIHAHDIV